MLHFPFDMAKIKSQKKRIKTNEKRRVRNKAVRTALKTYSRKVNEALGSGDSDAARAALNRATKALDVAASKGVIHSNNAANRKSALAKRVKTATSA